MKTSISIISATVLLSVFSVAEAGAQEPQLRPVRSYLTSGTVSDFRYFARRCTALYLLLTPKLRERGEDNVAETMEKYGATYFLLARQADVQMGTPIESADDSVLAAIQNVMEVLSSRMNRHMAITGSFIVGDPLIESDVRTCGQVAEELETKP